MEEIGSFEARTHFSELLRRVEKGEEFLVTMRGAPVASLTGILPEHRNRDILAILADFRTLREQVCKRGPLLAAGETWKEIGREGMKW